MTDEEKTEAITAKFLGEFHIGARVRAKPQNGNITDGGAGTICARWHDGSWRVFWDKSAGPGALPWTDDELVLL